MLSGRLPFTSPFVPKLLVMIAKDEPPQLSSILDDIPAGLAQLVHRCLFKDPSLRFSDADALATALLPFLSDSDSLLPPLLKAASLRPLRLSSRPPGHSGATDVSDDVSPTAGRISRDSLGPHTTAHGKIIPRKASVPRLAVATGIGVAALCGLAAGYRFVLPQRDAQPQDGPRAALSAAPDRMATTTFEAGPVEAKVTLTLDGMPLPSNPYVLSHDHGDQKEHVFRASADGYEPMERAFRFGTTTTLKVTLEPKPRERQRRKAAPRIESPPSLQAHPATNAAAMGSRSLDEANPY
jgi:serine/threonine protein kinase